MRSLFHRDSNPPEADLRPRQSLNLGAAVQFLDSFIFFHSHRTHLCAIFMPQKFMCPHFLLLAAGLWLLASGTAGMLERSKAGKHESEQIHGI
jgi:hypothetical protein